MFPVFPTLRIRRYTKARYIHAKYVSHQYLTSYQRSLSIHTSTTGGVCMARPLSAAPELKLQGARKILSKLKENILSSRWCIKINEPHSWVTMYAKSHTVSSVFTLLKTYRENYKKKLVIKKGSCNIFQTPRPITGPRHPEIPFCQAMSITITYFPYYGCNCPALSCIPSYIS